MVREIFTLYRKATLTLENSARSTVRKFVYTRKVASASQGCILSPRPQGHGQDGFVVLEKN